MKSWLWIILMFVTFNSMSQTERYGSIRLYVDSMLNSMPGSSGNNYQDPSSYELAMFDTISQFMHHISLYEADTVAQKMGYQMSLFYDTTVVPSRQYHVLHKKHSSNNYWGTYVWNNWGCNGDLVIQAPHPKFDSNTGKQAAYVFHELDAYMLYISGTHRCNNSSFSSCDGTTSVCGSSESYRISDVAHNVNSVFQVITQREHLQNEYDLFVQLHGFAKQPTDPYLIISNGTREENYLPIIDYASYIADAFYDVDNMLTSEVVHENLSWTKLTGLTNTQGRFINDKDDACTENADSTLSFFCHIEQEYSELRADEQGWSKVVQALGSLFPCAINGVEEAEESLQIQVLPNPVSSELVIRTNHEVLLQVVVVNAVGQRVYNANGAQAMKIDMANWPNGVYMLNLTSKEGSTTLTKVVKQ